MYVRTNKLLWILHEILSWHFEHLFPTYIDVHSKLIWGDKRIPCIVRQSRYVPTSLLEAVGTPGTWLCILYILRGIGYQCGENTIEGLAGDKIELIRIDCLHVIVHVGKSIVLLLIE